MGLTAVAAAEQAGQQAARSRVQPQLLRDVQRTAKRVREATEEHEVAIVRAAAAGVADRQIAERAGIAHATVRSIVRRHGDGTQTALGEAEGNGSEISPARDLAPAAG